MSEIFNFVKEASYNDQTLINFYNYYLNKHNNILFKDDKDKSVLIQTPLFETFFEEKKNENNILLVIDVQNDFLDTPVTNPTDATLKYPQNLSYELSGNDGIGSFGIGSSRAIVKPINAFIKEKFGAETLKKVIFSRDWHSSKHCSFFENSGSFPSHCLTNSLGAAFATDLIEGLKGDEFKEKINIIYKGVKSTVDSFGAFKYQDNAYLATRQEGESCCGNRGSDCLDDNDKKKCNETCSKFTGGFKREIFSDDDFSQFPFQIDNISSTKMVGIEVNDPKPDNIDGDKPDQLTKLIPFDITDLSLKENSTNNIFVCGLAGDYCVSDTAINIKEKLEKDFKNLNKRTNIYVVQDFTRYSLLPLFGPAGTGFSTPSGESGMVYNLNKNFFENNPNKPINYYVFRRDTEKLYPYIVIEDPNELKKYETNGIKDDDNLWHFISDDIKILQKYNELGIKIIVSTENLTPLSRGERAEYVDAVDQNNAAAAVAPARVIGAERSKEQKDADTQETAEQLAQLRKDGTLTLGGGGGKRSSRRYKKLLRRSKRSKRRKRGKKINIKLI